MLSIIVLCTIILRLETEVPIDFAYENLKLNALLFYEILSK